MARLTWKRAAVRGVLVLGLLTPATLAHAQQSHDRASAACDQTQAVQGHDGATCTTTGGAAGVVGTTPEGGSGSAADTSGNAATTGAGAAATTSGAGTTGSTAGSRGGIGQIGGVGITGGTSSGGAAAGSGTVAPPNAAATPELDSLALLGSGVVGAAGYLLVRRRARGATPRA